MWQPSSVHVLAEQGNRRPFCSRGGKRGWGGSATLPSLLVPTWALFFLAQRWQKGFSQSMNRSLVRGLRMTFWYKHVINRGA